MEKTRADMEKLYQKIFGEGPVEIRGIASLEVVYEILRRIRCESLAVSVIGMATDMRCRQPHICNDTCLLREKKRFARDLYDARWQISSTVMRKLIDMRLDQDILKELSKLALEVDERTKYELAVKSNESRLNQPISVLGLSPRVEKALMDANKQRLRALAKMSTADLREIRYISHANAAKIADKLDLIGIHILRN